MKELDRLIDKMEDKNKKFLAKLLKRKGNVVI